ncbi:MAG TPA: SsrA-binding protein SmpB [Elusimicrobiota bacterium]|nr:SsrA-binding protein SmpB [Elusimicrobiota bacterium]
MKTENTPMKSISQNRRASFRYEITETFEAGIVLTGPEVKSLRAGQVQLQDGFARVDGNEIYLWNVHISPYRQGSLHVAQEPTRRRKLLLHKNEIKRIMGKLTLRGLTLVPLEMFFSKSGYAKVKLGLGKGKTGPDRREDLKRKDLKRELRRDFKGHQKI